ncbi:MAG: pyruvate kinase [Propionibacteriaceae bacterium]|nr:pyruvate kinase [Propionibacteriaceae bacterium]
MGAQERTLAQQASRLRLRVQELIDGVTAAEEEFAPHLFAVRPEHRLSAINLVHYVWLRGRDIRDLQADLAELGLSSLGRLESRVLPTLLTLNRTLSVMAGEGSGDQPWITEMPIGPALLERNATEMLGAQAEDRASRIMVTFPSAAATDPGLVREMVEAGMDIARVNCAHDGPAEWEAMINNLRAAGGGHCLVAMDLAGPKLRTGPVAAGPQVVKVRPHRDESGTVVDPAVVMLVGHPVDDEAAFPLRIPVADASWLGERRIGEKLRFTDARGAKRTLVVTDLVVDDRGEPAVIAELARTAYFTPGLRLAPGGDATPGHVGQLPTRSGFHLIRAGEHIILTRSLDPAQPTPGGPHRIGCTLEQVFQDARPGERIHFDDGKIHGVITAVNTDRIDVTVESAGVDGVKLRAEKGINLPDTHLDMPALTDEDIAALPFVVEHADMVNYSFVRDERDVADLLDRVKTLGRDDLAVVLKIETVEAFQNLPQMLLEAMRWREVGVMIARGDLAVEAGFERLAEVQEEILWLCEAAHVPVIWATQVLESLAKEGLATRAEVTDAAMSMRAECVMLNKGPFIVEAIRFLHDVLERMQDHVSKKQTLLRRLRSWDLQAWAEQQ